MSKKISGVELPASLEVETVEGDEGEGEVSVKGI